ncbi:unnamed protein product [Fusarium fujikuroi]|nr:unnamed protein product [Fusarium fujikuroi]
MDKEQFSPPLTGSQSVRAWTNLRTNGYGEELGTHGMGPLSTPGYIDRLYDLAAQANRPVILNIVLGTHQYDHEFVAQLLGCFPNFPIHLLADIYESSTWGRGTVILPNTPDERSVALLANYPQVQAASHSQRRPKDDITPAQVNFLPILCWCSSVERPITGSQQDTQRIAIVVTISFHECVPEKMGEFWSIGRRQDRLAKFEQWAFLDLAATFSGWPTIWTNARRELAQRHASMYSSANAVADLGTTRIIHQDMANVIALREDLRLFIAAYAKYSQILRRMFPNSKMARINKMRSLTGRRRNEGQPMDDAALKESTELLDLLAELENRLQDSQQNLEHQLETSEVILRQLENLLSLTADLDTGLQQAFNTQAIAQGQATAMLNVLATIFLPLSFVASVFGMTKFEISAVWYPPAAAIVLFLVGGAILLLRWLGVDMNMIRLPVKPVSALISKQQNPTFRLLNTGTEAYNAVTYAETKEQRFLDPNRVRSQESVKSALGSLDDVTLLSSRARQQPEILGKLRHTRAGESLEENHPDTVKEPGKPDENALDDTRDSTTSKPDVMDNATSTTLSYYPLAPKVTELQPRLRKSQTELLESEFQKTPKPSHQRKSEIADLLQVDKPRINVSLSLPVLHRTLTLAKNWFQNRRAKERQNRRTRMLEAQPVVEWSNEGIVHGEQIAHDDKAPKVSTFGGIPSGGDGKVVQQFRTPQDYRVTGGGVPQLAASAAPKISHFQPTINPSANEIRLPARPSTHALQDYQVQLMLLEQQNKKRLMMARSEQDTSVAEGSSDAAGKSNFSNVDTGPEPQTEQRVYQPPSCQPANQLAGAGIVPAVVRDL